MTIYEMYGRLMEERQTEHEAHLRTIGVLRDLKEGRLALERVHVTETGWKIDELGQATTLANRNGLPVDIRVDS